MIDRPGERLEAIAARLELLRVALGFKTRKAFVAAIGDGMTRQKWDNYLHGRVTIPITTATRLCHLFHVDLNWIYHGDRAGLPRGLVQKLEAAEPAVRDALGLAEPKNPLVETPLPEVQPSLDAMLEKAPQHLREMAVILVKRLLGKTP